MSDDLTPGRWPVTRTAGDADTPTSFTVTVNSDELDLTAAVAQVRKQRARTSELVTERVCDIAGNVVTVGDGDVIPNSPGTYWWDLEVEGTVNGEPFGPLTVVSDSFRILADVSVEESS